MAELLAAGVVVTPIQSNPHPHHQMEAIALDEDARDGVGSVSSMLVSRLLL